MSYISRKLCVMTVFLSISILNGASWSESRTDTTFPNAQTNISQSSTTTKGTFDTFEESQTTEITKDSNTETIASKAINNIRQQLPIQSGYDLNIINSNTNAQGQTHTHIRMTYKGIPIPSAAITVYTDDNEDERQIGVLPEVPPLDTVPVLSEIQAKAIVQSQFPEEDLHVENIDTKLQIKLHTQLRLKEGIETIETATATDYEDHILGSILIYRAQVVFADDTGPHQYVLEIDANNGDVLLQFDNLHRDKSDSIESKLKANSSNETTLRIFEPGNEPKQKIGNGKSQYSGLVTVPTMPVNKGEKFALGLREVTSSLGDKSKLVIEIRSLNGLDRVEDSIDYKDGELFIADDESHVWGNFANYTKDDINISTSHPTQSHHGQTAAVDVLYGAMITRDLWKNVFGHIDLDGRGKKALKTAVHEGSNGAFALYGISYFPDPEPGKKQSSDPETVAHELAHSMLQEMRSVKFNYYGESGGIVEANSDIMGTLAQAYETLYPFGAGNTIPEARNWTFGELTESPNPPLRFFNKPSTDGHSYDYWQPEINGEEIDPHDSSGPMNRMFYFLSEGARPWTVPDPNSEFISDYLPDGMTGIGINKAAKIWYLAIKDKLPQVPNARFAEMREACIEAAVQLYGKHSLEQKAVEDAFAGVFVGKPAERTPPKITLSTSGSRSSHTIRVQINDSSGVQGGRISVIARNPIGLETQLGAAFTGETGSLYLGDMRNHIINIRVTANDTDGNESHITRWLDYENPVINDVRCADTLNHRRILRTCQATVSDAYSINRLEVSFLNSGQQDGGEPFAVIYRYPTLPGGISTTITTTPHNDTVCDTGCSTSIFPAPQLHTFEFEVDLRDVTSPGGQYYVKTKAYDNAGGSTTTNGIIRFRVDEWPPTLLNMTATENAGEIDLSATVFDDGTGHVNVTFSIDGEIVCEYNDEGYSYDPFQPLCHNSTSLSSGVHTFTARATDQWGNGITRSITFGTNGGDPNNDCQTTVTFYEIEPNGLDHPNILPSCTSKIMGYWHTTDTFPEDYDVFQMRVEPGQTVDMTVSPNCRVDYEMNLPFTNNQSTAVDAIFYYRHYSDSCTFGSYQLTFQTLNPILIPIRSQSSKLAALPNNNVPGTSIGVWIP